MIGSGRTHSHFYLLKAAIAVGCLLRGRLKLHEIAATMSAELRICIATLRLKVKRRGLIVTSCASFEVNQVENLRVIKLAARLQALSSLALNQGLSVSAVST